MVFLIILRRLLSHLPASGPTLFEVDLLVIAVLRTFAREAQDREQFLRVVQAQTVSLKPEGEVWSVRLMKGKYDRKIANLGRSIEADYLYLNAPDPTFLPISEYSKKNS